ncbi:F0F1 ATP synthase subunit alpha [Candidatus Roizmanbacteria bacterium CG2_30_33_16]|uniref:ATP synthase subunit alpha n=3 Tax=Candidatus Roizmaniibacteriota TaxID=1752723 RepID=A0A2H0C2P6_9BACT|nr:F0F1 ATP synthase subunit alpha [Candidatus Roizmanbacteria bacterium]OIP86079.1 MAG: F0F1 ATP synthase subunit alpha [Candidatus Roizmanbacteria bacterium CG2_30_33_16]PIP64183.1 MAG: F0F1 ATP synthase subunit alpha [Candidatus Roizmanbacteria bacterium CG22_combo_CG10-13_8_21_14_all_33_16]
MKLIDEYLKTIEKELGASKLDLKSSEQGVVTEIKDGVIILQGLDNAAYGELLELDNNCLAYVIDLSDENVGAIVLGDYLSIRSGSKAKALGRSLSIPVADELLGRIVDPLGAPLDNGVKIKTDLYFSVEKVAPGVVAREAVSVPVQTGIKAIDSLIPIGRGQRELIIGDRGTGKTTIAVDTILNQKSENMICVYCAIGQKNSKVAGVAELLKKNYAMDYTIIVSASASDSAAAQYLAPYSASAIAEYFMSKGKDVLVVYDDLTKHAWAYRQISLILRRPAGREAYPGDVFYLHSRLLERACRVDKKHGGGSITALPIIETLEGDVSAYIPTNVISITDGQIVLDVDLFNAGIKPAVNVGLSVSRVGGNAQTKAMKQVAGKLKLDLAQYRDMAAFSQFEGELDEETKKLLNRGAKITQILKQNKNRPYELAEQVVVIWAASKGYLDSLPLHEVDVWETKLISDLRLRKKNLIDSINKNKILDEKMEKEIGKTIEENIENGK